MPVPSRPTCATILSYNILRSGESRTDLICQVVRKVRPDVFVCVEARRFDAIQEIGRRLQMDWLVETGTEQPDVAIFSPHRLEPVHVPRPACRKPPGLAVARVYLPGAELLVAGVHLSSQLALPWGGLGLRLEQAAATVEALERLRASPHLLVGDFNAFPASHGLAERRPPDSGHWFTTFLTTAAPPLPRPGWFHEALQHLIARPAIWPIVRPLIKRINPAIVLHQFEQAGYVDCFDRCADRQEHPSPRNSAFTWPTFSPVARIDHVFATADLVDRVTACWIVDDSAAQPASDHLPVAARVEWC